MSDRKIHLYDCFTSCPGQGNPAAIVEDASGMTPEEMQDLARELGVPATCFIETREPERITARFFSPRSEYSMCGHAVIGLFTFHGKSGTLQTPSGEFEVEVRSGKDDQPEVWLAMTIPHFEPDKVATKTLSDLLQIQPRHLSQDLPIQRSIADFVHLIVPVRTPEILNSLDPQIPAIKEFCASNGIESIAAIAVSTDEATHHTREFCPLIGNDESAAGGTTNSTIACYLAHQGTLPTDKHGHMRIHAKQGATLGRPSDIFSEVRMNGGTITHLKTGGTAADAGIIRRQDVIISRTR